MTAYETADQVAFFDAMYEGARRAEGHAGHRDHHYSVAGHAVRLRIAGNGFSDKLPGALAHLSRPPGEQPTLTIHAWDDVSTGTTLPRLLSRYLFFVQMHCFDYLGPRNEMTDFHGQRIRAVMHLDPVIVSLFDPVRSVALYWTQDVARIPIWDWGTPLRIILNEWAKLHGLFLAHSGAVGLAEGGVIFAGKSGSGKSTSALACLDHGALMYAGDDYSLLSVTAQPYVHSLYSSAKLKGMPDFDRFSHLLPLVVNRDHMERQKALVLLNDAFREKVASGFPLRAILVSRISGRPETTIEPSTPIAALRALAPSTLLQLPGDGRETMTQLSALVRRVPAYTLNAGTHIRGIAQSVEALLKQLCSVA
ncbi:MAG TPA: hypothetical protein VFX42_06080 [Gemmatimonadales bacterium]|nr:hypothetical protein [Gemmatimonadales bacterium]